MTSLSVVIPTFNNEKVLRECLDAWRHFGGNELEIIVIEDGCKDGTPALLADIGSTPWGQRHLRWIHEDDGHELRSTNAGIAAAGGELVMAWQDDMFLRAPWLVPELRATFDAYPDLGMLSLSRGLNCVPLDEPIDRWEDLIDGRRLQSTIGPAPRNWFRLQEVDIVIRPWIVRRACLDRVGPLDEAFRPTEWDEADLACRIREAGWRVATPDAVGMGRDRAPDDARGRACRVADARMTAMHTGVGRHYRERSWLERLTDSMRLTRAPGWVRMPLKRAYESALRALPGDHL